MVVNSLSGLSNINIVTKELSQSLKMSNWQMLKKIRFPHALPYIIDGMKVAWPGAVIGAVAGEYIAAYDGIGLYLVQQSIWFNTDLLFAGIIAITIFSTSLFGVILAFDKKFIWWREETVS